VVVVHVMCRRLTSEQRNHACFGWLSELQLCAEAGHPGGAGNISAAHIIDWGQHQQARDADLLSTFAVQNGLPLCVDCHKYFDKRSLWTFRQEGDDLVAVVSNALKLHPRFTPKWCVSLLDTLRSSRSHATAWSSRSHATAWSSRSHATA
jgi:hypothetical protein